MPREAGRTAFQSAREKLPMSQYTMLASLWGSTRNLTLETRAVKKAETTTPESTRGSRDTSPWFFASPYATKEAMMLKRKAATWIGRAGKKATDRAQPNAAPAESPRRKGSTRGLRKIPCSVTPEAERAAPTRLARMILGSLIFQTMASSGRSLAMAPSPNSFESRILATSQGWTPYAPQNSATTPTARGETAIAKGIVFLVNISSTARYRSNHEGNENLQEITSCPLFSS